MAAGISASFCFLMVCFLVCSSEAQTNIRHEKITAELGQNMVILPSKAPNNIIIEAVEWRRLDQDPEYVLFYRDGHFDPHNQHPSYQNRVDLKDKDMKDGDVSLILKNVKMEDTGTYVCRVFEKGKNEPISSITLEVHVSGDQDRNIGDGGNKDGGDKDGGDKDGGDKDEGDKDGGDKDGGDKDGGDKTGIIVGPVVGVILLLAVVCVGLWIYRRPMRQNQHRPVLSVDPLAIEMEIMHESPAEPATASVPLMDSPAAEPTEM